MIRISISELIILQSFINKIRALNSLVCSVKEKKHSKNIVQQCDFPLAIHEKNFKGPIFKENI